MSTATNISAARRPAGRKRIESKKWSSQRSGGWCEPELRGRAEVQMNLRRLFASSDVVHGARANLEDLFSHSCSETELSRGSRESWPSVGEIWIVERSFHGFLPPVLKFPHLPFKFLTICCVCLQNVVNVLLEDFLYFLSFEQTHTNAALLASRNWSGSSAKGWRERSNEFESNSRSVRNGAAVQIRDGEPARPWHIHLECTQWLKCTAPAARRPSLSSLLRTRAASPQWLACLNGAKYHPSATQERTPTWSFSSDTKIKIWDTNIYDLCLWTQTRPLSWNSVTVYADDSSLSVTHRLPTYTADAFRRNDWKCKCQSSAESFSAHRLKAHRESESSRDVNWLKKSEGGLPGVCHAHFENLRTGVKARTPPPVACRRCLSGSCGTEQPLT